MSTAVPSRVTRQPRPRRCPICQEYMDASHNPKRHVTKSKPVLIADLDPVKDGAVLTTEIVTDPLPSPEWQPAVLIKKGEKNSPDRENTPPVVESASDCAPITTGKIDTSPPPLSLEIKGEPGRLYMFHPDDKQLIDENPQAAVDSGLAVPSITNCIGSFDKPQLIQWAAGLSADAAEERIRELKSLDNEDRAQAIDEMLATAPGRNPKGYSNIRKELGSAHRKRKDSAAARGTEVHAICEKIAAGSHVEVPKELEGYVSAYRSFLTEYPDAKFEYLEATVGSRKHGYAGTTDAIVTIEGKRFIVDLKTNDKAMVYSTAGMQMSAAANAEFFIHPDGSTSPIPEIDGALGVGLGPDGTYNVFKFETDPDGPNYQGFLASVRAWHWKRSCDKTPKPMKRAEILD